ncbi:MAG: PAS and helix-turn-helix domain-containing protein [Rubrivivax sp.]
MAARKARSIDFEDAFMHAPVGQAIGRDRVIAACNHAFSKTFRVPIGDLLGKTFQALYPTQEDFERTGRRIAPILGRNGSYADDRIMKRGDGELFWVHVSGATLTPKDPFEVTLWAFTDLSTQRKVNSALRGSMTPRERDIAALFTQGRTAKEIGKELEISHRTVDIYRTRLLRKYGVSSTPDLVKKLLST